MIRTLTLAALAAALVAPSAFAQQQRSNSNGSQPGSRERQSDRQSADAAPVSDQLFAQPPPSAGWPRWPSPSSACRRPPIPS